MAKLLKSPLLAILLLSMLIPSIPIEERQNTMFSKVNHHHDGLKKSVIFVGTSKNNVGEAKAPTMETPPEASTSSSPSSTSESENNDYHNHETGFSTPEKNEEEEDLVHEGEGIGDTRFDTYYGVGSEQEKESDRKTKNQRYVFDTMEEYEQYEESQRHYVP